MNLHNNQSYLDKLAEQTAKNKTAVRGFVIAIIVLAGGFYAYKAQRERYEDKAQIAFFDGEKAYQDAIAAVTPKEDPKDKKDAKTPPPAPTKKPETAQAEEKLKQVLKDYPDSNASAHAALTLSDIYADKDQTAEAVTVLETRLQNGSMSDLLLGLLTLRLSSLLEQTKHCDKALTVLEKLSTAKGNTEFKPEALMRQALCQEELGHNDKAKEIYQKLSTEFSDTQQGQQAQKYLNLGAS